MPLPARSVSSSRSRSRSRSGRSRWLAAVAREQAHRAGGAPTTRLAGHLVRQPEQAREAWRVGPLHRQPEQHRLQREIGGAGLVAGADGGVGRRAGASAFGRSAAALWRWTIARASSTAALRIAVTLRAVIGSLPAASE